MYFTKFPKTEYEFTEDRVKTCVDILKRVGLTEELSTNSRYWVEHDLKDGETPEAMALKLYGDTTKVWLLLLTNEILNPNYEWPLDQNSFYNRTRKKYADITGLYGWATDSVKTNFPSKGDIIGWTNTSSLPATLSEMAIRAKVLESDLSQGYVGLDRNSIIDYEGNPTTMPSVDPYTGNAVAVFLWNDILQKWLPKAYSYKRKVEEMHLGLHHFEDSAGEWVSNYKLVGGDSNRLIELYKLMGTEGLQIIADSGHVVVSNYDYEESKNESFRTIKVLKPAVQQNVEELLRNIING